MNISQFYIGAKKLKRQIFIAQYTFSQICYSSGYMDMKNKKILLSSLL